MPPRSCLGGIKIKALGQGEGAGGGGTPFRMSKFFEILVSKWLSLSEFKASLAKSYRKKAFD